MKKSFFIADFFNFLHLKEKSSEHFFTLSWGDKRFWSGDWCSILPWFGVEREKLYAYKKKGDGLPSPSFLCPSVSLRPETIRPLSWRFHWWTFLLVVFSFVCHIVYTFGTTFPIPKRGSTV
jgi:hypothetical protein